MKLLFDQNISFRIIKLIQLAFPQREQIRKLNLENKSAKEIWTFAGQNDFTIVTFDADFYEFSNLYGDPPKIIWLRTGNNTTISVSQILLAKKELIVEFINKQNFLV
ncbi:DUF5615 family PIN-like protein [Pedobacter terrae]|uniref:DUF5615 family PIN-like protein n=1 Tax=Pedobacter terrae TaxID=405671 RepID=UPI002FFA4F77